MSLSSPQSLEVSCIRQRRMLACESKTQKFSLCVST
jgi:hypothetical protein